MGVRVLLLDLSLSTTSFSICSWPGSNVRQDGTLSWSREMPNHSRERKTAKSSGQKLGKKVSVYIDDRVEEAFPQLPGLQVWRLEADKSCETP